MSREPVMEHSAAGDQRAASRAPIELSIGNDRSSLETARHELRARLERLGVGDPALYAVDLVLEELVGNTIRHGYDDDGVHEIRVRVTLQGGLLALALDDDARPFDPTRSPEPERPVNLEETRIGGLGISMVRALVRSMRYRREQDRNRLELEIALPAAGS